MMRRFVFLATAGALAACASTQRPAELAQATSIYGTLQANGAASRAEGALLKTEQAINQADIAVSKHQNQDYVNGLSHIALRAAQTAEAENAAALARDSAAALRTARLNRLVSLSQAQRDQLAAQNKLSQAEIAALNQRNLLVSQQAASLSQQAESLKVQVATSSQRADSLRLVAEEANARLDSAFTQLKSLVVEITNLKETTRGLVVSLSDVLFDVDKATLKPGSDANLQRIATILKQYPGYKISVEGHTDNTGSAAHNMVLSEERAATVKSALIGGGVDPTQITSRGFGETQPVATNSSAAGRQQNRRVEIVVLGAGSLAQHADTTVDTMKVQVKLQFDTSKIRRDTTLMHRDSMVPPDTTKPPR